MMKRNQRRSEDGNKSEEKPALATKNGSRRGGTAMHGGSQKFSVSVISDARRMSQD